MQDNLYASTKFIFYQSKIVRAEITPSSLISILTNKSCIIMFLKSCLNCSILNSDYTSWIPKRSFSRSLHDKKQ